MTLETQKAMIQMQESMNNMITQMNNMITQMNNMIDYLNIIWVLEWWEWKKRMKYIKENIYNYRINNKMECSTDNELEETNKNKLIN